MQYTASRQFASDGGPKHGSLAPEQDSQLAKPLPRHDIQSHEARWRVSSRPSIAIPGVADSRSAIWSMRR